MGRRVSKRTSKMNKRRGLRSRKRRQQVQKGGADKCFFIHQMGGIGNQLYIYAAALSINKKLHYPSIYAVASENPHSKRDYLDLLNIQRVNSTPDILARIKEAEPVLSKEATFYSPWSDSDIRIGDTTKDKQLLQGYYQSYPSIIKVIPEIKETLYSREFNKDKYKQFKASATTAFMHVRRGDYIKEGRLNSDDYYLNALAELDKNPAITTVYILSDDVNWCKQQEAKWKEKTNKTLECKDIPDELEALYCMSIWTGGAILSSSTFSSWGAFLGADMNPSSTLIYPKHNPITPGVQNPYGFPERWVAV